MKTLRIAMSTVALGLVIGGPAQAQETKAEVLHWWTSGGESAGLNVIADAFARAGGEWIDTGIAGGEEARAAGVNRIVGGEPPTAMQFNTGLQFDELISAGMLRNLNDVAAEGKWRESLPPVITEAIERDGEIFAAPINIHGENWFWYNTQVLADAGVEPPTNFADLIAAGPALEEAGVIPLALGGQAWQERLTFLAVLLDQGGPDLYQAVLGDNDAEAVQSEGYRQAAETFHALRDLVDEGSPGRNWNDATSMVVTGQAAVQIMGDWAKGEFIAAGMTPGEGYGCSVINADNGYIIGGDVFVFPIVDDAAHIAGQEELARVMMSPEVQVAFNEKKGSVPVLLNVDVSSMDSCAQQGMALLKDETKQIPSISYLASPDLTGALTDVITEFWNDPDMSVDTFIEDTIAAMESAG